VDPPFSRESDEKGKGPKKPLRKALLRSNMKLAGRVPPKFFKERGM